MRKVGVCKWFNASKGYGFITMDGNKEVFVHYSEIQASGYRSLQEGDKVEFDLLDTPKGLKASSVAKI